MYELQISGLKLCIDWHGEEPPTDEQIRNIIYACNNAMFKINGSPVLSHILTSELGRELFPFDVEEVGNESL